MMRLSQVYSIDFCALLFRGFTFLVPAHLGSPRHSPGGRETVVVVVYFVVLFSSRNLRNKGHANIKGFTVYFFETQCNRLVVQ